MAQGSNQVGLSQPVYLTNADGSASGGSQTSANSQSVTPASDGSPFPVVGNVANGTTDSGSPVKVGGRVLGVPVVVTSGARTDLLTDVWGAVRVGIKGIQATAADGVANNAITMFPNGNESVLGPSASSNYVFNNTSWDRMRGDTTGAWSHNPPSTVSSALSGTIATSGTTAAITMTNTTRTEVLNPSSATLWASWGTPTVNGAGSFPINAGGFYNAPDRSAGTLTLLSTAASQPYTVNRFS